MPQHLSRRDFLTLAGIGGASLVALGPPAVGRSIAAAAARPAAAANRSIERVLVVIELAGGNDGLSMAPPDDADRLARLRPTLAHGPDELARAADEVLLHPALGRLAARPLCVVDGLGSPRPDGSHFEMMRRWATGDPLGDSHQATGVLGRMCDVLDVGAPATGVSIGGASSPALLAERAGTIGVPEPWWLWWLSTAEDDEWARAYRDALAGMSSADSGDGELLALARRNLGAGLDAGAMFVDVDDEELPEEPLARKLAMAAQLITADIGVRVIHVPFDGDFDTHEQHRERHDALMEELDAGLDGFLAALEASGDGERVLVATTSEFGRRPEENGSSGLDHGTASAALLLGPVSGGRVGEPASLTDLDDDGNVVATVPFDRYFATIAEGWFELDSEQVLPTQPEPLAGVW